ncbi:MAG: class I tRNA ligase family protein [Pirellulales bacterium]|nr:class I tRNA ligase family protein [Pirellulales bacterium]
MSCNPITDSLPAQYDYAAAQEKWYDYWVEGGYFHADPEDTRTVYSLAIPPPNVTGALHLGHALNITLQDILVRMRRMQGYNTLWMPGTDHAGIATQAVVEKRLLEEEHQTRHDLGREKLVQRIWEWKKQYETRILGQLKRLGASCDWERTRFTLDSICARAVRHWFFRLFQENLIYRGKRLVNWDTYLQTTVSDDEVFHETVQGHFWHIRYPVLDPRPGEPTYVEIATTRPETLLGDTAVAVHPDPAGALDRAEKGLEAKRATAPAKERPAIQEQLDALRARRKTHVPKLELLRDMAHAGCMVMLPLVNRRIPLITDPWAKPELGTGCVKITPAHDENDYEVGLRCQLPLINILNPDGTLNEHAGPYQGLTIPIARKRVINDLDDLELLGQIDDREIDLAHSDRSKTPIEPYLTDQWFIRMDQLAQSAMDAVTTGRVRIIPERYAKGYLDWLQEKRDWPIGRQLWWGHQIPIWSQTVDSAAELENLIARLDGDPTIQSGKATYRVEPDEERQPNDGPEPLAHGAIVFQHPLATVHVCIAEEDGSSQEHFEKMGFVRQEDVLDTWFSSALWPHSTLGWPEKTPELERFYPTNTLITSRDIITLWVARMVLAGQFNMGDVPFREVYIHPKILDGFGETMSKTKGNGVDPLDVIDKFGADALRFGLAFMTTETQDVRMPVEYECPHCNHLIDQTRKNRTQPKVQCPKCKKAFRTQWANHPDDLALPRGCVVSERFELGRNFANKLWNAARFVMINLEGYTPAPVAESQRVLEDRWLLSRLATVTRQVTEALDTYRYADAARALYDLAWDEFCSFYVEMAKPRLQADPSRPIVQRLLVHTLDILMRLLHPFIPFLTEDVWQRLGTLAPIRGLEKPVAASESILVAPWPTVDQSLCDPRIEEQFATFQTVLSAVREIRSCQNIPPKESIRFQVRCNPANEKLLRPMVPYFLSMARAEASGWGRDVVPPKLCASVTRPGLEVYVDVSEFLDVQTEKVRLEKERDQLENRISAIDKKLKNASFVTRAPTDVVARERARLVELTGQRQSIESALDNLNAHG